MRPCDVGGSRGRHSASTANIGRVAPCSLPIICKKPISPQHILVANRQAVNNAAGFMSTSPLTEKRAAANPSDIACQCASLARKTAFMAAALLGVSHLSPAVPADRQSRRRNRYSRRVVDDKCGVNTGRLIDVAWKQRGRGASDCEIVNETREASRLSL